MGHFSEQEIMDREAPEGVCGGCGEVAVLVPLVICTCGATGDFWCKECIAGTFDSEFEFPIQVATP